VFIVFVTQKLFYVSDIIVPCMPESGKIENIAFMLAPAQLIVAASCCCVIVFLMSDL
jgi:hypothetical protein